jgi:hypothetical protein
MMRTRSWLTSNFAFRSQRNRTQPLTGVRNLIRFSEDQSNALWTGYSAVKNGFHPSRQSPNGEVTMSQFTPNAANSGMYQVFTAGGTVPTAGLTFTVSAWLASTTGTTAGGFNYYDGAEGTAVTFTLNTTPTRYSATFTLRSSPVPDSASNVTVMGVTNGVPILWWGYQLERGSSMTQYSKKL